MAHGSDIRRIGKFMRSQGADGSLVAWVEAELDRLDLRSVQHDALRGLRDDLTMRERELIVRAVLHLAVAPARVRGPALDMASSVAEALALGPDRIDALSVAACGRTLEQVRMLASLKLAADASPAEVRRAQERHMPTTDPGHRRDLLDSLFEGEHTDPGSPRGLDAQLGEIAPTPDATESRHHTERMDHLADALRAVEEGAPTHDELLPAGDEVEEPTVEMSRTEVDEALQRVRSRGASGSAEPEAAPPRFSPAAGVHDGPPSLGVREDDLADLASTFDDSGLFDDDADGGPVDAPPWDQSIDGTEPAVTRPGRDAPAGARTAHTAHREPDGEGAAEPTGEPPTDAPATAPPEPAPDPAEEGLGPVPLDAHDELQPIAWDEHDLTMGEWTLSETPPRADTDEGEPPASPDDDDVSLLEEPPLPYVEELGDPGPDASPEPAVPAAESAPLPVNPEATWDEPMVVDERGPPSLDDLEPDLIAELPLDVDDAWVVRRSHTEELPLGLTDEVPTVPPGGRHRSDGLTDELSLLGPDDDEGEVGDGLTAELRPVPDEGSGGLRATWAPPPAPGSDTDGLTAELIAVEEDDSIDLPMPETSDSRADGIQPLDEGLAAYWAPKASSGSLTAELEAVDEPPQGLTGELKVIHDDDLLHELDPTGRKRRRRRGTAEAAGLTQDLQPLYDAPPGRRKRRGKRSGGEGLTQDLRPLLDDDD